MNLVIQNLQNLFITSLEKILKDLDEADIDQILVNAYIIPFYIIVT